MANRAIYRLHAYLTCLDDGLFYDTNFYIWSRKTAFDFMQQLFNYFYVGTLELQVLSPDSVVMDDLQANFRAFHSFGGKCILCERGFPYE